MKNEIILLSEKQKDWEHSRLFLSDTEREEKNVPFEVKIQDDLKALFASRSTLDSVPVNMPVNMAAENTVKNGNPNPFFSSAKDVYATCATSATSVFKDLVESDFLIRCGEGLPAPLFITESATSSLDIAHFLVQHVDFVNRLLGNPQASKIPPFTSILCRNQSQGRGQLRRNWSSPSGNIYAALFLPNLPPFSTESAAPALGALLAHAFHILGFEVALKWPNDIVQKKEGKYEKIAGILLEERQNMLIAGIGINVLKAPSSSQLRENYFMEAGTLSNYSKLSIDPFLQTNQEKSHNFLKNIPTYLKKISSNDIKNTNVFNKINTEFLQTIPLWCALVEQIFLCYKNLIVNQTQCQTSDFSCGRKKRALSWQELVTKYLAFKGEEVKILHPIIKESFGYVLQKCDNKEYITGKVCGINPKGELILQINNQIVTILGGTFSQ